MKKSGFYIYANSGGCPQNQLDGAQAAAYLQKNGHKWRKSPRNAEFIIVNGCGYHLKKEQQYLDTLINFRRFTNEGATIIASGCLPKIAPESLQRISFDGPVIPASELHNITKIIPPRFIDWQDTEQNRIPRNLYNYASPFRKVVYHLVDNLRNKLPYSWRIHWDRLLVYNHSPKSYIVRVGEGCLNRCAYCAIRLSRGKLNSKPIEKILAEIKQGIDQGETEIILTATELAAWGRDAGMNLADLLEAALKLSDSCKFILLYANPRWMIDIWDRLEPVFKSGRITFCHLSLNGGSDGVLKRMNRGYTLGEFNNLVEAIKASAPGTVLQTQIITGFPGETEEEFQISLDYFTRNFFNTVHVHAFSPRPNTDACSMPDQISESIRQKRRKLIYKAVFRNKLRWNWDYITGGFLKKQIQTNNKYIQHLL